MRIDAKKLRYLVDVTPAFYDAADLERILGALKKLQRVLGDFNDAQVQEQRLLECGRASGAADGPAGAVLALGRLAERMPAAPRAPARTGRRRTGHDSAPATRDRPVGARSSGDCVGARPMSVVAIYNMKGGVGKTTTAVNLSYLAAAAGQRTLLWDLDPQAASSFAFRVRPRVAGFGRKSLESGQALAAAIKETDYDNLDLLPADFAYRKLDRLLDHLGKPKRVVTALLDTLGRDYDVVFLDCPAGFSLLTEGIFAAADAVLVPTIPTVLSLRTVAQLIKWADRSDSPSELAAFFSMVDRRKALHRRACDWSANPRRDLSDRTNPLRQRRGTDGRPAHAAPRVRRTRRCDDGVRRNLGRAPDTSSPARRSQGATASPDGRLYCGPSSR